MRRDEIDDWNRQVIDEFRTNGGVVGGQLAGVPLLLLHTTGARSGAERVHPVTYRRLDTGQLAIFASKAGAPSHPDWYHNLLADPHATIELGTETFPVVAVVAKPEQRDAIWEQQKVEAPVFADYESRTDRQIPVVILERAG